MEESDEEITPSHLKLELVKLLVTSSYNVLVSHLEIMPNRMEFVCCREKVQVENECPE